MQPAGLPRTLGALLTRRVAAPAQTVALARKLGKRCSTRFQMTCTNDSAVQENRY